MLPGEVLLRSECMLRTLGGVVCKIAVPVTKTAGVVDSSMPMLAFEICHEWIVMSSHMMEIEPRVKLMMLALVVISKVEMIAVGTDK